MFNSSTRRCNKCMSVPEVVSANQALKASTNRLIAEVLADDNELSLVMIAVAQSSRLRISYMEPKAFRRAKR